jgi:CO dehydrogenase maturation factor
MMIVTVSGKGGVGKTSLSALVLDELARQGYGDPVLAVDGDPASTLHLALGFPEPTVTVADVRDSTTLDARTVRSLPAGTSPADYVRGQLQAAGVLVTHRLRQMSLDVMPMGQGEGPGCYCRINHSLAAALEQVRERYSLVLIDNEAGLEHLSRYRIKQVDLFLVVTTPGQAAWSVARRILDTARQVGMELGETGTLVNRVSSSNGRGSSRNGFAVAVPNSHELAALDLGGQPVVLLPDDSPVRAALRPVIQKLIGEEYPSCV